MTSEELISQLSKIILPDDELPEVPKFDTLLAIIGIGFAFLAVAVTVLVPVDQNIDDLYQAIADHTSERVHSPAKQSAATHQAILPTQARISGADTPHADVSSDEAKTKEPIFDSHIYTTAVSFCKGGFVLAFMLLGLGWYSYLRNKARNKLKRWRADTAVRVFDR